MRFCVDIEPMGAVRMTRKGKYVSESAKRYLNYKRIIYNEIKSEMNRFGFEKIDGALEVDITFFMPIPGSWSEKKKAESLGTYHTKKPDIDNLVKGLFDAVNGLIWEDDNRVVKVIASKIYDNEPAIVFNVRRIGGLSHGQAQAEAKEVKQGKARGKKDTTR